MCNVQAELEGLDNFRQDYAATRATMHKLNEVLDALCEHRPDYVCPITHDIMRMPVTASSGKTYEASALRAHCATQRSHGIQPTCPLTTKVLCLEQVGSGQGNFSLKGYKPRLRFSPCRFEDIWQLIQVLKETYTDKVSLLVVVTVCARASWWTRENQYSGAGHSRPLPGAALALIPPALHLLHAAAGGCDHREQRGGFGAPGRECGQAAGPAWRTLPAGGPLLRCWAPAAGIFKRVC